MARLLVIALLFSVSNVCWSQCVRGNCATGYGTYVISSSAKYVGAWKYGRFHGQGTYTYPDGRKYVGEFKDGERNGQGTLTYPSGQKYVGEFKDSEFHGQGTYTWPDGQKYVGEFKDGERNGQGTLTFPSGQKYVGEYKDDEMNGQGTHTWPDGQKYVGEFKDDKRNGQGTHTWPNGDKNVGAWKDDKRNGQGTLTLSDGLKYVGEYKDDKRNGQGTLTFPSGQKYVGEFKDGEFHGQGTLTFPSGQKYVGEFKDGKPDGQGIGIETKPEGGTAKTLFTYADGEIVSEEKLTPKKISEIVQEQMASAHNLLSALGYGVGSTANLPNPLLISAVNSYCSENEAELRRCPDLGEIQVDFASFLSVLQTSIAKKQTQLESATIIGSGSAFRLNAEGTLATSSHVINNCLAVSDPDGNYYKTTINNQIQDLAVLDLKLEVANSRRNEIQFAQFADEEIELGQSVFVAGFPYASLLKSLNFTEGSVSSLSGIGGNTQHFQITAPMQPGNSGGPILSEDGAVVGIAVGKLDEEVMAKLGAGLPQNVNFGIDAQILKKMLDSNSIRYEEGSPFFSFMSSREKVAGHAQQVTERINCWGES